jgi:hypothetical protein
VSRRPGCGWTLKASYAGSLRRSISMLRVHATPASSVFMSPSAAAAVNDVGFLATSRARARSGGVPAGHEISGVAEQTHLCARAAGDEMHLAVIQPLPTLRIEVGLRPPTLSPWRTGREAGEPPPASRPSSTLTSHEKAEYGRRADAGA